MLNNIAPQDLKKYVLTYGIAVLFFIVAIVMTINKPASGVLLFLPIVFIVYFILKTQRIIEALFLGNFLLLVMAYKDFKIIITEFSAGLHNQVSNPSFQFVLLAGSLIGGVTALIGASGSGNSVDIIFKKFVKGKKGLMLVGWILSSLLFITEFLQIMLMGPVLSENAKKQKISKERLTYIIKSVGVPVGVLIPTSIWSVFIISQFEAAGISEKGQGMSLFLKTIPLNFFPLISVFISLLVTIGIFPLIGKMKKAEELAEQGIFSEGVKNDTEEVATDLQKKPVKLYNFIIPLVLLVGLNIIFDFDSVAAGLLTLAITAIIYVGQGLLTPENVEEHFIKSGVGDLITIFIVLMLGLFFADNLIHLGFIDYLISVISNTGVSPILFPVLIFIFFSIVEFSIFLNWTLFILMFPIIGPLAESIGAHLPLSIAAIISAVVFGSNTSFLSDSTLVISPFTNTKITDHLGASLPYQLISIVLSAVAFLIAGYILT